MLAFVIPFKPKRNSRNWELDCNNLNRTLRSIINQSSDEYYVYVIHHDVPANTLTNKKVEYVRFPYVYVDFEQIEDLEEQMQRNSYLGKKDVEYLFDQGRKQMFGANLAKQNGFEYIMSVDGDDIVSKELVQYIKQNNTSNKTGWFVNKGYFFIEEDAIYLRQPYAMNMINGSTHIIHHSLIPEVDLTELTVNNNNFFSNHPYLRTRIREYFLKELQPLPFYAIIYVVTNLNWNATTGKLKKGNLRNRLKYLVRFVLFKRKIRQKFYLYD